ncbi:hypothetical protein [Capsulimonas corticalis]|nr:hypothetical protein [Capsulimonas corticalis]
MNYQEDEITKLQAIGMALLCVRNTCIEHIHSGIEPQSKTGDYSDVHVVTPYGEIPWNNVSRITDDEMREWMKEVVNKLYTFLIRSNDIDFLERMTIYSQQATHLWEDPKNLTKWFTGKWDNGSEQVD